MPVFYIHLTGANENLSDIDGLEFIDLNAAIADCERAAGECISQDTAAPDLGRCLQIYAADGQLLHTVSFQRVVNRAEE